MKHFISLFFSPPPIPEYSLPVAARLLPHVKLTIAKLFEFAYERGVLDGFIMGVLVALLFMQSIKTKGASNVED